MPGARWERHSSSRPPAARTASAHDGHQARPTSRWARRRARGHLGRLRPRSPARKRRPRVLRKLVGGYRRGHDGRGARRESHAREVAAAHLGIEAERAARSPPSSAAHGWALDAKPPGHAERTPAPTPPPANRFAPEIGNQIDGGSAAPSARPMARNDEEVERAIEERDAARLPRAVEQRAPREAVAALHVSDESARSARPTSAGRRSARWRASRAPSHRRRGPGRGNFRLEHGHSCTNGPEGGFIARSCGPVQPPNAGDETGPDPMPEQPPPGLRRAATETGRTPERRARGPGGARRVTTLLCERCGNENLIRVKGCWYCEKCHYKFDCYGW